MDKKKTYILTIVPSMVVALLVATFLLYFVLTGAFAGDNAASGETAAVSSPVAESVDPALVAAELPQQPAPSCEFAQWVGQPADEAVVEATGRPYRIVKPGQPMTMDYNAERINVMTDDEGIVLEVRCG